MRDGKCFIKNRSGEMIFLEELEYQLPPVILNGKEIK